jgi:preprotein translocase subunit SecA
MVLQVVDVRWREHLENMDYLREGIHLRGMAQKDPLVEYRNEGHILFQELNRVIHGEVLNLLFHAQLEPGEPAAANGGGSGELPPPNGDGGNGNGVSYQHETTAGSSALVAAAAGAAPATGALSYSGGTEQVAVQPVVKSEQESVGRNDPCWCGSGKKYKRCHGA